MKKSVKLLSAVLVLTLCLPAAAYAGQWVQDPDKKQKYGPEDKAEISNWWYREDDGSYPVSDWKEIDGKWYYFNEDGWMLRETTTPDQMKVDHNGVWVPDILKAYPAEIKYNTIPPRFSNGQSKGITFTDSKLIGDIVSGIAKLKLEPLEDGKDYSTGHRRNFFHNGIW